MSVFSQNVAVKNIERFENILKSPQDERLYRGLKLHNGLRALLISDSKTDKSAASLAVNVGSLNEPKKLPGLAHFLEHMLFMGSKKYPEENDYSKFISEHAGHTNAFTAQHQTNFYFDISPDFLVQALDRFAQFFIEPLMDESATQREVNSVNSEHEKNISEDAWRIRQLEKSLSKPKHPYSNFSTGNKETLDVKPKLDGISVREELLKFHNEWYSANRMCLVVLGRESLDELENVVLTLFSDIQNKNINKIIYHDHPFGSEQLKRKVYVVPVKDIHSLRINFPTPDVRKQYKTGPEDYISHLIGHEGPGSLYSLFREKGLCHSLSSGILHTAPGFGFFNISIDLTEEGLNSVDELITLCFQYINLLKSKGICKWIWEEEKKLEEMTFRFKDKESPTSYVVALASKMDEYPIEDLLSANHLISEWREDLISDLLKYLNPENIIVYVISKSFENIVDTEEKWYGTKYKAEQISDKLIQKWKDFELSTLLHLPPVNEFVPENFDIYPRDENEPKNPYVILESSLSRIWFKQDDEFLVPKLVLQVEFFSPLAVIDPGNSNMIAMFVSLLKDSLNEYAYAAEIAGLKWNIASTKYGMQLGINGYNDKLKELLQKIVSRMINFTIDPKRFEIIKELFVRSLKNFNVEQPHKQANYYLSHLLTEWGWTYDELLEASNGLLQDKMEKFLPELLSRIFMQGLIHGNCNKELAMQIINIIETPFKGTTSLLPQQLLPSREINIDSGCCYVYEKFVDYHSSSCLCVYFQCSYESTENNTIIELFEHIINEPCYNILRTKEQLGYIVASGVRRRNGVQGLVILIQSEKHPVFLNSRVETFLKTIKIMIEEMSDEDFGKHKTALATIKLEKPKKLSILSEKFWHEITFRHYNFDRVDMEVKHLKTLRKDDILNFYQKILSCDSASRRKLSVHVISKKTDPQPTFKDEEIRIGDVTVFKNYSSLCPLPKSYIKITPVGTKSKL